ncbi:MAG TPA: hypothetical protein VGE04_12865 [Chloroflexia bacterium]
MFSLVSFTGIWRYRRSARRVEAGNGPAGGVDAAEYSEEYFPQDQLMEEYDPATANDFSYEDAVLDTRVRHFMREEYGRIEPPRGVYQRLIGLLKAQQAPGRAQSATAWARLFVGMYRAFNGQTLSRLVPSGIAVAVLVVVGLGSTTSELLRNSPLAVVAQSTPVAAQTADSLNGSALIEQQITQVPIFEPGGQDVVGGEERYIVVRGGTTVNMPQPSRQAKNTEDSDNIKYNRPRLDPF